MFKFLIAFVLAVACAQEVVQPHEAKHSLRMKIEPLNVIGTAIKFLEATLKATLGLIENLLDTAIQLAKTAIDEAILLVKMKINGVLQIIKALIDEANNLGIPIVHCIGDNVDKLEKVPDEILAKLNGVLQQELDGFHNRTDHLLAHFNSEMAIFHKFADELNECGWNPICNANVLAKATVEAALSSARFLKVTAEVVAECTLLQVELAGKLTKAAAEALQDALTFAQSITKCLQDAIQNSTSNSVKAHALNGKRVQRIAMAWP